MGYILGLDLGTNSIGWALVNQKAEKIIDTGVRIFPEGINRDAKGAELSKNETRRNARQTRRQYFRKKMRKKYLIETLRANQMCPEEDGMKEWYRINPYDCRAKAIEQKISLMELGRAFYHMSQRRGFLSNRKSEDKKDNKIIKGNPQEGKIGIEQTEESLTNFPSLGSYLNSIDKKDGEPYRPKERIRGRYTLRRMYKEEFDKIWDTQKQYYPDILTDELRWRIGYKPATSEAAEKDGILFFQRPLKSQKFLIGRCTFEPSKPRTPESAIPYQLFRSHAFINTIEYGENNKLGEEQRGKVIDLFNKKTKNFKFKEIRKTLSLFDEVFNYPDDLTVPANTTIAQFRKLFTPAIWDKKPLSEQEHIWHIFTQATDNVWLKKYAKENWAFDDKQIDKIPRIKFEEDYANLSRKAIMNMLPFLEAGYLYNEAALLGGIRNAFGGLYWGNQLNREERQEIIDNVIAIASETHKEGELIERLKDYLKIYWRLKNKDLKKLYHHSDQSSYKNILEELPEPEGLRNPIVQKAMYEVRKVINEIIKRYGKPDRIHVELAREMKMSRDDREKLRIRQAQQERKNNKARAALDHYGLRHTRNNIQKYLLWEELKNANGIAACPYSGKTISINDLFNDNKFQIEHIVPRSVSLDDSFNNKTLCDAKLNQEKGDLTPYQFYKKYPSKWEEVKERARSLIAPNNYVKYKKFISEKEFALEDFVNRQLSDTRYISKKARDYLQLITPDVRVISGGITSELRHFWGLNTILGTALPVEEKVEGHYWALIDKNERIKELKRWNFDEASSAPKKLASKGEVLFGFVRNGQFIPQKKREDHRHHAIDALTLACTTQAYVHELAKWNKHNKRYKIDAFPEPWVHFHEDARNAVENILISYARTDRILTKNKKRIKKNGKTYFSYGHAARGQLHKENIYGRHYGADGEQYYHIRKPLEEFNKVRQLYKIVDKVVLGVILNHLQAQGIEVSPDKSIPANTFFKIEEETGKKVPLVYLSNDRGQPVPVKKVRIKENMSNAVALKQDQDINQYVNPKNNHHVEIFMDDAGNYKEHVASFWEAVERKKQGLPVVQHEDNEGRILTETLKINDLFVLGLNEEIAPSVSYKELSPYLYRVQKISSKYYTFRHHLSSDSSADNPNAFITIQSFSAWRKHNPQKIRLDMLGKLINR